MKLLLITLSLILSFTSYAQHDDFTGLKKINGTKLFVTVRGQGEPLLFIHGGPGLNHHYFLPHLNPLEKKFKVIYYDQRACGASAIPSPDSISMQFMVEDIEAIRKELNIDKLNVLAHSWGVVLASHYALKYGDKIKKMIFSNPVMLSREYDQEAAKIISQRSTKADSIAKATLMSKGSLDVKKYEQLFLLSFNASAFDRSNVKKIELALPANFTEANNALFSALMKDPALGINLYDSINSFHFPILIVHGEADAIPMSSIERLKKTLPDSELEIFKRSGHFPFIEERDRYIAVVSRFLTK